MTTRLDQTSRLTIKRFGMKLLFAVIFAGISRHAFFLVTSLWLSVYALTTSVIGIITRDRLREHSFTHWDEALWLAGGAALFRVLSRLA